MKLNTRAKEIQQVNPGGPNNSQSIRSLQSHQKIIVIYISTTVHCPKPQSQDVGLSTVNHIMMFPLACIHASFSECIEKNNNRILSMTIFKHSS